MSEEESRRPGAEEPARSEHGLSDAGRSEDVSMDGPLDKANLAAVLRVVAETQRDMLRYVSSGSRNNKALASIKLEEFDGGPNISALQYRKWKKDTLIKQKPNQIKDTELALIIHTQVKGDLAS